MRAPLRATLLTALLTALLPLASALAADETGDGPPSRSRTTAGGRLIWIASDKLDLLGDVWADLPFALAPRQTAYFGVDTRTAIERTSSTFTFEVRDLDYHMELGWRGRPEGLGGTLVSLYVGQRGQERVDASGQAYVRYLGVGVASRGFHRFAADPPARVEWRLSGGPVFQDREVEAGLVLRGEGRWRPFGTGRWRGRLGIDWALDGLLRAGTLEADVSAGPGLSLPADGGSRATFFLRYQRSRNPLGIRESGLLAGFEYAGGAGSHGPPSGGLPEVDGLVAAGSGEEGRLSGELELCVHSPPFAREASVAFLVDANILTAGDTGNLYYLWNLGLERLRGRRIVGVYFYHRSNHQLAEENDRGVTSLNVLEAGVETRRWRRPGTPGREPGRGSLEGRMRLGFLLNSTFGEERRWHVRAGARWSMPWGRRRIPFLEVDLEAGDVARQAYALGTSLSPRWEARIEFRNDEQYFGADRNALLLIARCGF